MCASATNIQWRRIDHVCKCKERYHPHPTSSHPQEKSYGVASTMRASARNILWRSIDHVCKCKERCYPHPTQPQPLQKLKMRFIPRPTTSRVPTTWFPARRLPWCFGGTIIVIHKMNATILRGKTHMPMTLSHPNMTCVGEKRPFYESWQLIFLTKESSELLQEWVWIVTISFMLTPHPLVKQSFHFWLRMAIYMAWRIWNFSASVHLLRAPHGRKARRWISEIFRKCTILMANFTTFKAQECGMAFPSPIPIQQTTAATRTSVHFLQQATLPNLLQRFSGRYRSRIVTSFDVTCEGIKLQGHGKNHEKTWWKNTQKFRWNLSLKSKEQMPRAYQCEKKVVAEVLNHQDHALWVCQCTAQLQAPLHALAMTWTARLDPTLPKASSVELDVPSESCSFTFLQNHCSQKVPCLTGWNALSFYKCTFWNNYSSTWPQTQCLSKRFFQNISQEASLCATRIT